MNMNLYIAYFDNENRKWVLNDRNFIISDLRLPNGKSSGTFTTDIWFSKLLDDNYCSHFIIYSSKQSDMKHVRNLFNIVNRNNQTPAVILLQNSEYIKHTWHFTLDISAKKTQKYKIMQYTYNNQYFEIKDIKTQPSLFNNTDPFDMQLSFQNRLLNVDTLKEYSVNSKTEISHNANVKYKLYISHPWINFRHDLLDEL